MTSVVVIPVYKEVPSKEEVWSLRQCFKVLAQYEKRIVCPMGLNTVSYNNVLGQEIETVRFAPEYFDGIDGYNKLMLSQSFYKTFASFDYMLIYQLDAWVFNDELRDWCDKGYDYIGAPWFELHKTHEEGYGLWCCGNGGLSLRKVQTFIKVTNPQAKLFTYKEILKTHFKSLRTWWKGIKILFHENNLRSFRKKYSYLWEDGYFCYCLDETKYKLKRPTPDEAAKFSFECSPSYLYSLIGNKLPFGCHAWQKYHYEDFWFNFIPEIKTK